MKPINIIVNGAFGKMGTVACQTLEQHPEFVIKGQLRRGEPLEEIIQTTQADVVLDLTRADCAYENSLKIIQSGASPVIGTSGLTASQIIELQKLCEEKKLGGIIVPNFSIAAVLMMHFSTLAAPFLNQVEIIEAHHPQKLDAPSGTARRTAELIQNATPIASQHAIPIHSVRLPGILARQEVLFGQTGETLSITHQTIDRISFMPGLVLACQKAHTLDKLYCGLEHLLFEHRAMT
jgi:4-hydroxy-tetrahydrodipicolinate reductase